MTRSAILESFGSPLVVREHPDPEVRPGEVLVAVQAACILPYTDEVFSGRRRYPLEPPVVPGVGAVGRVVRLSEGSTQLRPGDTVWCDPTVRSRDDVGAGPDITLQGWSSRGEGGARLARTFHDGSFAEHMVVPTENAIRIGTGAPMSTEAASRFSASGVSLVPYGGFVAADLRAGETVVVSGATGNFGSAAVAVALALGAARVVAPGRNRATLDDLSDRLGDRVVPVALSGDQQVDDRAIRKAADGPVDVVLDLLPPSAGVEPVRTAAMTVREYGRVVLMGGVGMLGGDDLALPYPWIMRNSITVRGQWMYQLGWVRRFLELVRAGVYDLSHETVTTFGLDEVNEAVAYAAGHGGPFTRTVLTPGADIRA